MVTKLAQYDGQTLFVLEQEFLDTLHTYIERESRRLILSPVQDSGRQKKFHAALEQANCQYGRMLKNLAEEAMPSTFLRAIMLTRRRP